MRNKADIARIRKTLSGEIDTRHWIGYAIVDAVAIEQEGVFLDLVAQPLDDGEQGNEFTARWGMLFAGKDKSTGAPIGLVFPPPVPGTEVVVLYPSGDPDEGPVAFPLLFNQVAPMPTAYLSNSDQILLETGSSKIVVRTDDNVKIDGAEINFNSGTKGAARLTDEITIGPELALWIGLVTTAINAHQAALALQPSQVIDPVVGIPKKAGTITSASSSVKIGD